MSSNAMPDEGALVRVTLEGRASKSMFTPNALIIGAAGPGMNVIRLDADHVKSVEVLPEPESWEPGDVVLSAAGVAYRRTYDATWHGFSGYEWADDDPSRPLTLLARDGEPVAA